MADPKSRFQGNYELDVLSQTHPPLAAFVMTNQYGKQTIDFANPNAVKALNTALLKHHYPIQFWDFPDGYLCPPIPGRAAYIHHLASFLARFNEQVIPSGKHLKGLDIGTGATCIYPILGYLEYKWQFLASETDEVALENAQKIIESNPNLQAGITVKRQTDKQSFFAGVLSKEELIDFSMCNPPFYQSAKEAQQKTQTKLKNLKIKGEATRNFGGKAHELWYPGGELKFLEKMILESKNFQDQCLWFTSLVSQKDHLKKLYAILRKVAAVQVKTVEMQQGNKKTRFLAWTFFSPEKRVHWVKKRWSAT